MSVAPKDVESAAAEKTSDNASSETAHDKVVVFGDSDPDSPLNWAKWRKWLILLIICFGSGTATCCSSMIASTYEGLQEDFHVSHEVATRKRWLNSKVARLMARKVGLSLFVIGLCLGPLLLGPLSEFIGRRPVYLVSFFIFAAFNIPLALAKNIGTILAFRFLSGLASAAFFSVAGGSVTDLFAAREVSLPMSIYTASPFIGPALGPLFAGYINAYAGWRWVWHFMYIWAFSVWGLLVFFTPETYAPKILKQRAARLRKETGDQSYQSAMDQDTRSIPRVIVVSCYKPFEILALEPMALFLNLWTALLLGIVYAFFSVFPIVFASKGFSTPNFGLSFIGILLGNILGPVAQLPFTKIFFRKAKELGRLPDPEEHLRRGIAGGIVAPLTLLGFAFTTYPHVHWIAPMIFTVPFGVAIFLIFSAVFTYLVSAFRPVAASAMASNTLLRCAFAAGFPLFTVQATNAMHPWYFCLLLALLLLILIPLPILLFLHGSKYRKNSKYAVA